MKLWNFQELSDYHMRFAEIGRRNMLDSSSVVLQKKLLKAFEAADWPIIG